jgi:high frequency lysogenization protein
MPHSDRDRLLALAGIYQAALCVRQIARQGTVDTDLMEPCLYGLFQTDAESVAAVFGGEAKVALGVRTLLSQLTGKEPRDLELTRYLVSLLKLERVLAGRPVMVRNIADGIAAASEKLEDLHLLHPELLATLGELYAGTISLLGPRIMVQGEPIYLKNEDNQARIRALLLAGIRAAWLWRQVGGSRWQILIKRRRLLEEAREYLRQVSH